MTRFWHFPEHLIALRYTTTFPAPNLLVQSHDIVAFLGQHFHQFWLFIGILRASVTRFAASVRVSGTPPPSRDVDAADPDGVLVCNGVASLTGGTPSVGTTKSGRLAKLATSGGNVVLPPFDISSSPSGGGRSGSLRVPLFEAGSNPRESQMMFWPTCHEDGSHQRMLIVVAMEPHGRVCHLLVEPGLHVEFVFRYDSPASFRNDPERCYAVIVAEVVPLWHVIIAQVDFEGTFTGCCRMVLGHRGANHLYAQSSCCGHAVIRDDYHVNDIGKIPFL
ncbi:hypothetical protein KC329_g115 [Hortaea werneckii]|nr:hypothetical protein KC329_g115 [Hortaea werneckii]